MRIAISSRNRLFREGLASTLKSRAGWQIVTLTDTAKEAVKASERNLPDVFVVDRDGSPKADLEYLLGLQTYVRFGTVLIASEGQDTAGFPIVVRPRQSGFDLARAVRSAAPKVPPGQLRRPSEPREISELTPREHEISAMIAQGLSTKAIADATGLKTVTVNNFVSIILRKLGCKNRLEIALKVRETSGQTSAGRATARTANIHQATP
jgi:DNA-binding NarL/FixJ family response regulator